jgi:hypothetical protein
MALLSLLLFSRLCDKPVDRLHNELNLHLTSLVAPPTRQTALLVDDVIS